MNKLSIGVFVSGTGSTLKAVNEAIKNSILQLNIDFVLVNKSKEDTYELSLYCEK